MTDTLCLKAGVLTGVIHGKLPSIKNGRRIVYVGAPGFKRPISIKAKEASDFYEQVQDAKLTALSKLGLDGLHIPLAGKLEIDAAVYHRDMRPDLDIECLCDALQMAGLIENDRQFWIKKMVRRLDKFRPRVEFTVKEIA